LFDDEAFSKYIEEKILIEDEDEKEEDSNISDDMLNLSIESFEEKKELEVTEWEIQ
jgi:hypothetical protein